MEIKNIFNKAKVILPASLMFFTLTAFAQNKKATPKNPRSEVNYKQLHSTNLGEDQGLFADGIKLKMDLSVLKEAEAARESSFDINEIPADDIYGGVWRNAHVNIYGSSVSLPDSFVVNLANFTMPLEGRMTSNFGRRGRIYHYGVDIKLNVGDTIYAAFDGKIRVQQFERGGYGNYVVIRHVNGLETVYGHLSRFLVNENDFVKSGQPIALGGNTGRSTGPHLHFETRFLGRPINPNFLIDFNNSVCHRDEYLVTNSSFGRTSQSSRMVASGSNYKAPTSSNNKFVSGSVKYYRIKKGDTLGAIAQRHRISVSKLCSLNNITSRTTLRAGKSLRVS